MSASPRRPPREPMPDRALFVPGDQWEIEEDRREKAFITLHVQDAITTESKALIRMGVPCVLRHEVWFTASGGRQLTAEVGDLWDLACEDVVVDEKNCTFGCDFTLYWFPIEVQEKLMYFLSVVHRQNKEVAYAPMIPIVSAFLLMFMEQRQAYAAIQAMINRSKGDGFFFSCASDKFAVSVLGIVEIVREKCKKVDQKAVSLGVSLVDLFRETMLLFLVANTILPVGLTIFDAYLTEGKQVLLRIFIALLKSQEKALRAAETVEAFHAAYEQAAEALHNPIELGKLLKAAYSVRFSKKEDIATVESRISRLPMGQIGRVSSTQTGLFMRQRRPVLPSSILASTAESKDEPLLTPQLMRQLRPHIEVGFRRHDPVLVYRLSRDGAMFETMVECASESCPYIVLIRTERQTIGAFLSDPPMNRGRNGSYFGRASTFVFRASPFVVYCHKPENPVKKFISVVLDENEKSLAVGGPGRAIYIENQLSKVASWPCEAFESPAFTGEKGEPILDIELYKMVRGIRNANTVDLRDVLHGLISL